MALSAKEKTLVSSMSDHGFDFATSLHAVAYKAISKAFCDKEDHGEFAAAVFKACPTYAQKPLASWLRRHGLNITTDSVVGNTDVGGPTDYKKSDYHIRSAKADCNILPLVQSHIVRKEKPAKEYLGTLKEQAAAEVEKLVKRVKGDKNRPNGPEVAATINVMLNSAPEKVEVAATWTLVGGNGEEAYDITPEEFALLVQFLEKRQEIAASMLHIEKLAA